MIDLNNYRNNAKYASFFGLGAVFVSFRYCGLGSMDSKPQEIILKEMGLEIKKEN
mgnify:CR=1 FL=1